MEKFESEAVYIRKAGGGFGPEPIKTLEAMGQLSATLSRQGRHDEAVALQEEVVNEMTKLLSPDDHDPRILEEERREARNYTRQGKHSKAEATRRRVLEKIEKTFGKNHLNTMEPMFNLASTHDAQGQYRKAEDLLLEVLEGQKRLGASHFDMLKTNHSLSMNYVLQGRPDEAEKIQAQLMKMWSSLGGDLELAVIKPAIMGLAATEYSACGRHAEAIALQLKILDGHKVRLGDEHELTITAMNTLGLMYYAMGNYYEALPLWTTVSEVRERQTGSNSPDVATCMHQLSWAYFKLERLEEANEACRKAERIRRSLLSMDHPDYRSTTELVKCLGIHLS
jgi:tetratricopeptide (TPR) repeat protein